MVQLNFNAELFKEEMENDAGSQQDNRAEIFKEGFNPPDPNEYWVGTSPAPKQETISVEEAVRLTNVVNNDAPPGFDNFWENACSAGAEEEERKRQELLQWAHDFDMNDGSDSKAWMEAHWIKQYGLPEAVPLISMSWNAPDSTFTPEERQELDENYRKHRFWGCYEPTTWNPDWTPEQHIQHWRAYKAEEENNLKVAEQYAPKKPGRPRKADTGEKEGHAQAYNAYLELCQDRKEILNELTGFMKKIRQDRDAYLLIVKQQLQELQALKTSLNKLIEPPSKTKDA